MKTIKYLLCVLLVVMGMATLDSCCYPSPWSEAKEIKQLLEIFPRLHRGYSSCQHRSA